MKKANKKNPLPRSFNSTCKVVIRTEKNLPQRPALALIRRAVAQTLAHLGMRGVCSLSILLAGDKTLTALNRQFRGFNRVTDVLSFASGIPDPEDGSLHLGELALSIPRASAQARARHRTLAQETTLLVVHGVLHLLGFDHDTAARKKRMWSAQRAILKEMQPRNGDSQASVRKKAAGNSLSVSGGK